MGLESSATLVFDLFASLRGRLSSRTNEINAMSEREVMGAADSVARIVSVAGGHVDRVKSALSMLRGTGGGVGITGLIRRQIETIDAFSREVRERVGEQQSDAEKAAQYTRDIASAARSVATLSHEAHILALNARIEAGRLAGRGASFSVIAGEMQRLSKTIAGTNALIDQLTRDLTVLLPQMSERADAMQEMSAQFSERLATSARDVEQGTESMHRYVTDALEHGDTTLTEVVHHSQEALSHLQFQDTVAQGLTRVEDWLIETQADAARILGLDDRVPELTRLLQAGRGGGDVVDIETAGDVLLF